MKIDFIDLNRHEILCIFGYKWVPTAPKNRK